MGLATSHLQRRARGNSAIEKKTEFRLPLPAPCLQLFAGASANSETTFGTINRQLKRFALCSLPSAPSVAAPLAVLQSTRYFPSIAAPLAFRWEEITGENNMNP